MQLHVARLCLDCQEIHDSQTCPICSSESFAYISRWIPAPERRVTPRAAEPGPQAETYRQLLASDRAERAAPGTSRWLKRGVFGLAAVSAAAWALKRKAAGDDGGAERPPKTPSEGTVP
jgi:predicted  nucleic acid-binding Zn-ribbon protein